MPPRCCQRAPKGHRGTALDDSLLSALEGRGKTSTRTVHHVGSEPTMERVSLARALTWKRRRVYHRMSASGELILVENDRAQGPPLPHHPRERQQLPGRPRPRALHAAQRGAAKARLAGAGGFVDSLVERRGAWTRLLGSITVLSAASRDQSPSRAGSSHIRFWSSISSSVHDEYLAFSSCRLTSTQVRLMTFGRSSASEE